MPRDDALGVCSLGVVCPPADVHASVGVRARLELTAGVLELAARPGTA